MAALTWHEIPETAMAEAGGTYRITLRIKAPYTPFLAQRMVDAVKVGTGLRNLDPFHQLHDKIKLNKIYSVYPKGGTRTGRSELWSFIIEFTKVTKNPAVIIIYGLIALIIAATAAVLIAGKKFERLMDDATVNFDKAVHHVLNPGFVLAGFIVAVLFLKRG